MKQAVRSMLNCIYCWNPVDEKKESHTKKMHYAQIKDSRVPKTLLVPDYVITGCDVWRTECETATKAGTVW